MAKLWRVLKRTFSDFSKDECSQMAAALAYYAAFPPAPLLVLLVLVCGIFWEPQDVEHSSVHSYEHYSEQRGLIRLR